MKHEPIGKVYNLLTNCNKYAFCQLRGGRCYSDSHYSDKCVLLY